MSQVIRVEDLKQVVDSIERLEDQKYEISQEVKEAYLNAKSKGYDSKTLKKVITLRKRDRNKVAEEDALMELYREALGV